MVEAICTALRVGDGPSKPLTVSVLKKSVSTGISHKQATVLDGLTHDLSASPLAINIPAMHLGDLYLTAPNIRLATGVKSSN